MEGPNYRRKLLVSSITYYTTYSQIAHPTELCVNIMTELNGDGQRTIIPTSWNWPRVSGSDGSLTNWSSNHNPKWTKCPGYEWNSGMCNTIQRHINIHLYIESSKCHYQNPVLCINMIYIHMNTMYYMLQHMRR